MVVLWLSQYSLMNKVIIFCDIMLSQGSLQVMKPPIHEGNLIAHINVFQDAIFLHVFLGNYLLYFPSKHFSCFFA